MVKSKSAKKSSTTNKIIIGVLVVIIIALLIGIALGYSSPLFNKSLLATSTIFTTTPTTTSIMSTSSSTLLTTITTIPSTSTIIYPLLGNLSLTLFSCDPNNFCTLPYYGEYGGYLKCPYNSGCIFSGAYVKVNANITGGLRPYTYNYTLIGSYFNSTPPYWFNISTNRNYNGIYISHNSIEFPWPGSLCDFYINITVTDSSGREVSNQTQKVDVCGYGGP